MYRYLYLAAWLTAALILTACGSSANPPQSPPSTGPVAQQVVSVDGNHFTLNGNPWIPRGVVLRGFEAPTAWAQANAPVIYQAHLIYDANELAAISAFGADTIRILISQPGLDPNSAVYDANYFGEVAAAVQTARDANFVVEIAMQDEAPSGEANFFALPSQVTQDNWDKFNNVFGTDRGVIFELYNEPALAPSPNNWVTWANGGFVPAKNTPAFTAIGMQALADHLRAAGSINTFVVDGLGFGHSLDGFIAIRDPLDQVGYAVHPYFSGTISTASDWDTWFGNASATVPVFADEWSAASGGDPSTTLGLGASPTYQPAVDLLNYLREHGIGLGGGGFDAPGFMNQDVPGWTPTNYDGYSPTKPGNNAGALIRADFMANYARPLTPTDGLSQVTARAVRTKRNAS